jgi:choline kinase
MRVISLLAGACTRLHPLTLGCHKAMLNVGGYPVLDWQLEAFRAAAIADLVLVVGHGRTELEAHVGAQQRDMAIRFVRNDEFARYNMDYSLHLASEFLDTDLIFFEGDMLVHPSILSRMVAHPSAVCLAVDRKPHAHRVDTLVRASADRVNGLIFAEHGSLEMVEHLDAVGEFLCTIRFSREAALVLRTMLKRCKFTGPMQLYKIFDAIFSEFETGYVDTTPFPWIEIDTIEDLQRADALMATFVSQNRLSNRWGDLGFRRG